MDNRQEMRNKATAYRKQNDFQQALPIYQNLWEEKPEERDKWDGWGYAYCLQKTKQYVEGLKICREVIPIDPEFEYIRSVYAWCLYYVGVNKGDEEISEHEQNFWKAANEIVALVKQEKYSTYESTVMQVVDYLRKKPNYPAQTILEWLDKVDTDKLSTVIGSGKDGDGKVIEYASNREKWFVERCKAFFKLERYADCLDIGERTLKEFPNIHYGNDIWTKYHTAMSKGYLGDKVQAVAELQEILKRKHDWFIQRDVAIFLLDMGRMDEALPYALEAACAPVDIGFKWKAIYHLAKVLQATGRTDDAKKHVLLVARFHQEKGLKIGANLSNSIGSYKITLVNAPSSQVIYSELRKTWDELRFAGKTQVQGRVKKLIGEGKSGFIVGDEGKEYHFVSREFRGSKGILKEEMRVTFYVEKNPEAGRKDNAISICAMTT